MRPGREGRRTFGMSAPHRAPVVRHDESVLTHTTDFTPGPGGVMTDEVGVITGELTLRTELTDDGTLTLRVQYKDADEWYTVSGGEARFPSPVDPAVAETLHDLLVKVLTRGGAVPPESEGWTPQT